ncbi:hypothetical protein QBC35DRAFT_455175 [Podospora australis]|uniref:Uncharacterized protein n=1 Tax=Podospora australis TaxID=1536484 RepID=A0AAN6WMV0_9PEZI|nr:hypothetical protein QBC35DRAFT_455175 [Podospora australis]
MLIPQALTPLLVRAYPELAANNSSDLAPSWVLEPDGRGTFGILRSCIITLALCVYTAIHLNIPGAEDAKTTVYLRKAKWVVIAMFAPELVVYVAWCQRQEARWFYKEITKALVYFEQTTPAPKIRRNHTWTMTHSWYAYMGGFSLDPTPRSTAEEYINGSPRLCLHRQVLRALASSGCLPDFPKTYIDDKKEDWSSALAAMLWVSSWQSRSTYGWSPDSGFKRDTTTATYENPSSREAEDFIWIDRCSLPPDEVLERSSGSSLQLSSEADPQPKPGPSSHNGTNSIRIYSLATKQYSWRQFSPPSPGFHQQQATVSLSPLEVVIMPTVGIIPRRELFNEGGHTHLKVLKSISIDKALLERWNMMWQCFQGSSAFASVGKGIHDSGTFKDTPFTFKDGSKLPEGWFRMQDLYILRPEPRVRTWCAYDPRGGGAIGITSLMVILVCTGIYGGIHVAAWKDHFPSSAEHILWKVSCLYLSSIGVLTGTLATVFHLIDRTYERRLGYLSKGKSKTEHRTNELLVAVRDFARSFSPGSDLYKWYLFYPGVAILGPVLLVYAGARLYLVIEAFVSLRSVPQSAYQTPDWTRYLPHL